MEFFRKQKVPTPPPTPVPILPSPVKPSPTKPAHSGSIAPLNARLSLLQDITLNDTRAVSDVWNNVSKNREYTYSYEHLLYDMLCKAVYMNAMEMLRHIVSLPYTTKYTINNKARLYCFLAHANEDIYRIIISRYVSNIVGEDIITLWKKESPFRHEVFQLYINREDVTAKREVVVSLLPYRRIDAAISIYENLTSKRFQVLDSEVRDIIMIKKDDLTNEFVANIKPYVRSPVINFIIEGINNSFNAGLWAQLFEKFGPEGLEINNTNIYNIVGSMSVEHYIKLQAHYELDKKKVMISAAIWDNMALLKTLVDNDSHVQLMTKDILYLMILRWQFQGSKKGLECLEWFLKSVCSRTAPLSPVIIFNMPFLSLLNDLCFMKLLQKHGLLPTWSEGDIEEYVKHGRNCDIPYTAITSQGLRYLASLVRSNIGLKRVLLLEAIEKEMSDLHGHTSGILSECEA